MSHLDDWLCEHIEAQDNPIVIGSLRAVQAEIERLRATNAAWMNGVADVVEMFGYDRDAASGPADLLPGLIDLATALIKAQEEQ